MDIELWNALSQLAFFQKRAFQKNPYSAKKKRRLCFGIRETLRNVEMKKVKAVIVSSSIEDECLSSPDFVRLNRVARRMNVQIVWTVLRMSELGRIVGGHGKDVSVIGVLSYEGCHEEFMKVLEESKNRMQLSVAKMRSEDMWESCCRYGMYEGLNRFDAPILVMASRFGHIDIVEECLKNVSANTQSILNAVKNEDEEMLVLLLDNLGEGSIDYQIIFSMCCQTGDKRILDVFLERCKTFIDISKIFCTACADCKNTNAISLLHEKYFKLVALDSFTDPNLAVLSIVNSRLECLKYLLKHCPGILDGCKPLQTIIDDNIKDDKSKLAILNIVRKCDL